MHSSYNIIIGRRIVTVRQLQEYLEVKKWKDSENRRADMCGRYQRCRYCVRTEEMPCAMAYSRLVSMRTSDVPDPIPEWLLPDPPVAEVFGTKLVSEEESPVLQATSPEHRVLVRGKGDIVLCRLKRRAVQQDEAEEVTTA